MTHSIDKYQLYASLNDDIINEHTKALNELLINKYIVAAHYSRVENIELIKSEGLRLLNKEEFAQRLMKIASRSDCTRKERDEFEEYLYNFEKYNSGPREGLLSFVYPSNRWESCNRLTTAIGGEIVANAEGKFPNIYHFLSTVGTLIKLIAKVPFADVDVTYKKKLICKLIAYILSREFENESSIPINLSHLKTA